MSWRDSCGSIRLQQLPVRRALRAVREFFMCLKLVGKGLQILVEATSAGRAKRENRF
jgi:hypothetical protein